MEGVDCIVLNFLNYFAVWIVDARNPLLFRSADLEAYVKEVDPSKENIILVNKSDVLTPEQQREKVRSVFWSTLQSVNEEKNGNSRSYDDEKEDVESAHSSEPGSDSSIDEPSTSFIPFVNTAEVIF
uniref:Uncharacterized protein n=1 Tax=Ditylenchus dipsaci TaxID=166011 RepID=A0A915DWH2_9BILA